MTNVRRKGTFRAQAAERSGRAAQSKPLPPRCARCRLPGVFGVMIDGIKIFFCGVHVPSTTEDDKYVCGVTEDHDWRPGDIECRRCQADLSEWNEEDEK